MQSAECSIQLHYLKHMFHVKHTYIKSGVDYVQMDDSVWYAFGNRFWRFFFISTAKR